jgi:hypothetical protein
MWGKKVEIYILVKLDYRAPQGETKINQNIKHTTYAYEN